MIAYLHLLLEILLATTSMTMPVPHAGMGPLAQEFMTEDALNHEFHLTRTTINYNTTEQSLQLTMNVFLDDLELALLSYGADSLFLCSPQERADGEDYMFSYLSDHLIMKVDGTQVEPQWIGKEQTEDLAGVWCYLEVPSIPSFSKIDIENTIMIELYDDQKNMTNLQRDKKRITDVLFTAQRTSKTLDMYD